MSSITQKICKVRGCEIIATRRRWCSLHYRRWIRHGDSYEVTKDMSKNKVCKVDGCTIKYKGLGYCTKHYQRFKKYGDPIYPARVLINHSDACLVNKCNKPFYSMGYCQNHYYKYNKYGNPLAGTIQSSHIKHGLSKNCAEYRAWQGMKARCFNSAKKAYKDYGGRGITVCLGWKDNFIYFYDQLGIRQSKDYSLDRINNDGNYSCGKCDECIDNGWPMNCRWATRNEQAKNQRIRKDNKSGIRNLSQTSDGKWVIHISRRYSTFTDAKNVLDDIMLLLDI